MAKEFTLPVQLKVLAENAKRLSKRIREETEKNVHEACDAMVNAAKEHTPHSGDGKRRGFNVISNALQDGWHADIETNRKRGEVANVRLSNDKDYATFVQNGHRVSKHFVPWLYKDSSGTLSYATNHSQKMFGLFVGNKTNYVKGVDMIGPALEEFNKKLETFDKKLTSIIEDELFNEH